MNYLAHLYFAQDNPDSCYGNLLGDFRKGVNIKGLPSSVQLGLANHYLVDTFTDNHPIVKMAKRHFSKQRRRFAGVILDVLYDHFLIKHWQRYSDESFIVFKARRYSLLKQALPTMPEHMSLVVNRIVKDDWLAHYTDINGVGTALDNIAKRIRFANQFSGCIEEIEAHYDYFDNRFQQFFPDLIHCVENKNVEGQR